MLFFYPQLNVVSLAFLSILRKFSPHHFQILKKSFFIKRLINELPTWPSVIQGKVIVYSLQNHHLVKSWAGHFVFEMLTESAYNGANNNMTYREQLWCPNALLLNPLESGKRQIYLLLTLHGVGLLQPVNVAEERQ